MKKAPARGEGPPPFFRSPTRTNYVRGASRALLVAVFTLSNYAQAHLRLDSPVPRHPNSGLKTGPCGTGPGDLRSTDPAQITTYRPGETITIQWTETIDHPAHYRIAFSKNGDGDFVDPSGYDDKDTVFPELLDGIVDVNEGNYRAYEVEVVLPNEECDNCTLQVIQVMYDRAPWGGGNDIYYQCADIVLSSDMGSSGSNSAGGATNTQDSTGGASSADSSSADGTSSSTNDKPDTGDKKQPDQGGCHVSGHSQRSKGIFYFFPLLLLALSLSRLRKVQRGRS